MRNRRDIAEWVRAQVRGLGSLASATGIVLGVLLFATYSVAAPQGEQVLRAARQRAATNDGVSVTKAMKVTVPSLYIKALTNHPISLTAVIDIHGWKNRGQRIIDTDISRIEATGSGAQVGRRAAAYPEGQITEQLSGQRVLASVSAEAAEVLPERGRATVALVVTPLGETATLVIDQVIEPVVAGGAKTAAGSGADPADGDTRATADGSVGSSAVSARVSALSRYWGRPGTAVTLTGSGFGRTQGSSWVTCGGVKANVRSWSDSRIVFTVPAGMKKQGYIGVVKSRRSSNGLYFSPFDRPVITGITPNEGAPGTVVTIKGRSFGKTQSDGWVSFSGSTAQVVSWSDTALRVVVPRDARSGYAGVVAHGMTSNGVLYGPLGAPLVTSVSSGVLLPDQTVSIRGRGFGTRVGGVAVGGVRLPSTHWSPTEVRFTVPRDLAGGYVGVIRADKWTSNGVWVPNAPRLDSVSRWWVSPLGELTLRGVAFGTTQGSRRAYVGGTQATVKSWSDDTVTIQVPANAASGYVGVGTSSACSNGIYVLVETPAHIDSISSRLVSAGDRITIRGSGFGPQPSPVNPTSKVVIASDVCAFDSWSDDTIVAVVPDGVKLGYVGVVKRGVTSNGMWVIPFGGN